MRSAGCDHRPIRRRVHDHLRALAVLAHSMSLRQVDVVAAAMLESGSEIGSGPRSVLRAALAEREAVLQNLEGFEITWNAIADSDRKTKVLLNVLRHMTAAELPRWFSLAWKLILNPRIGCRCDLDF